MFNASAMFQIVSVRGIFLPSSIIARWLRAIPDSADKVSCDNPRFMRSLLITIPNFLLL